jgi:hypothetical protein
VHEVLVCQIIRVRREIPCKSWSGKLTGLSARKLSFEFSHSRIVSHIKRICRSSFFGDSRLDFWGSNKSIEKFVAQCTLKNKILI